MAGKSTAQANTVLDAAFGSGSPATWYLALYTAAPTDAGGGTEVTGGSYARKAVTNNATNFPAASGGSKSLNVAQTYTQPTGTWGLVTHFAWHSHITNDTISYWGALGTSQTIVSGNPVTVAAGAVTMTED